MDGLHLYLFLLRRILQADVSPETRQMCKDLIDSLAIKVPTQKMSGVLARTKGETVKERYYMFIIK